MNTNEVETLMQNTDSMSIESVMMNDAQSILRVPLTHEEECIEAAMRG